VARYAEPRRDRRVCNDAEREFDYTAGAEQALDTANAEDWTVVSVKDDWATVFR
jgi:hypothetical protein